MRIILATTAAAALLAGCSDKNAVTATNSSVETVQKQVEASGAQAKMSPGRWEGTTKIAMSGIPGAPSQAQTTDMKICVKPEDIKPGQNPFAAMTKNCTYDNFKMADGKVDATMTCDIGGMKTKSTTTGEFTSESYKIKSSSQGTGEGPMGSMKTETTVDLRRTGDCKGDETGAAAPAGA